MFRCPSSQSALSDTSPTVCRPYLSAKDYVQPRVQPYYDEYAAPYVVKAQPYVHLVNSRLVRPASKFAQLNYAKYAAPQIDAAKTYSQTQWEKQVRPQVNLARGNAAKIYEKNLASHVDQVNALVGPYYSTTKDSAYHVYEQHLLPAFESSRPHVENAYVASQNFALNTAYPFLRHTWADIVIFVDGTFVPLVKNLYIDNVRPQLVMIHERIAKYRESRHIKAAMDEVDSAQSTFTSFAASSAATTTATASIDEVYAMFESEDEPETASIAFGQHAGQEAQSTIEEVPAKPIVTATEEQITQDLIDWQKKFAAAADKGSDDLQERVLAIVSGLVKGDVDGLGRGLATALEKTAENEIDNVKSKIKSTIAGLSEDATPDDVKNAAGEILGSIRTAGAHIKERAKNVRQWSQNFEQGLIQRLATASASTLEVLDGVKDVGLQEVGMRWAWMEGVTYKHWEKFHGVRKKLDEWKTEVSDVAMRSPEAEDAIASARQITEESMAVTEDAAKELARLKGVAQWKLKARDASDDFETRSMPAEAVSAASSLVADLQGVPSAGVDSASSVLSEASKAATQVFSSASSAAAGTPTGSIESIAVQASSTADEAVDSAVDSAASVYASSISAPAESAASQVIAAGEQAYESASSVVVGTSTGTAEAILSGGSESISSLTKAVSSSATSIPDIIESTLSPSPDILESLSSAGDEVASSASSMSASATTKVSKVFAGAMAAEVTGSVPILDDVFDESAGSSFSESLQDVVNAAGDRYADVTRAVSEAIYGTSQGTVESLSSVASEQYSSALAAASDVLYGTPTGTIEGIANAASENYDRAVAAASSVIFGVPTPAADSYLNQASSFYDNAVSRAQENYDAAKSIASKQISGTPKPIHEQMFSSIESAYSGAVDVANSRLSSAQSAASSAMPTANPFESISKRASAMLQNSIAAASAQYSNAKVAVGATPAPAQGRYLQEARKNYYAAVGMAHEQYDDFVKAASGAIYGTPTPVLSSWSSAASVGIYGTPVPAYQNLIDAAASQYSVASSAAVANLNAFTSSAGTTAGTLWDDAMAAYSSAIDAASSTMSSASYAASTAIYGAPAPCYQSALDNVQSQYDAATLAAASQYSALLGSASSAMSDKGPATPGVLDSISSQYDAAVSAASSSLSAASYAASTAFYGAPTGSFESISNVASQNWEALVSKASEQIYGTPQPFYNDYATKAGEYSAQITDFAGEQYVIIQSFVSELIIGKEPDFSESVMSRLSSAYYTGYGSAASFASEAYGSASSVASSLSSAAVAHFTPPPEVSSVSWTQLRNN